MKLAMHVTLATGPRGARLSDLPHRKLRRTGGRARTDRDGVGRPFARGGVGANRVSLLQNRSECRALRETAPARRGREVPARPRTPPHRRWSTTSSHPDAALSRMTRPHERELA
jgi:hypothetical protein